MKDITDTKTVDFIGGEPDPAVASMVVQAVEDAHLAAEHKLVAVKAYIKDEAKADKKTKNAERQQRFLEKQKESGMTKAFIPADVAEAVKLEPGGFPAWLEKQKVAPAPVPVVDDGARAIGQRVLRLTGWRRVLVRRLLGLPGLGAL